jgi:hypothetical protein
MNNEQVMEIMESLGLHEGGIDNWVPDNAWVKVANAVEAAEREACAKLCDKGSEQMLHKYQREGASRCAEAIRARGIDNMNKQAEQNGEEL